MKKFTVVGYYDDNGQVWVEHTEANDSNSAVVNAVTALENRNDSDDPKTYRSNIIIVSIFEGGHHVDINDAETVSAAIDWPGLEVE